MPVNFSFFDILIIIGLTQGLVTSGLLLTNKQKLQSKRILGFTILVFCLVNCKVLLHSTGMWNVPVLRYLPVGMELLLPPLVYLYVLSLTQENYRFQKKQLWHLLPGLAYAIYDTVVYLAVVGETSMSGKLLISNQLYFDLSNLIEDYLIVVLSFIYVVLGIYRVRNYLLWLSQFKDYKSLPIYKWLKNLMFWSALLGSVLAINQSLTAMSLAMEDPMYRWRFFNLLVAFVTYYIGFMGYKNDSLNIHLARDSLNTLANKLSRHQIQQIETSLRNRLETEQAFLDGELTLKQLAASMQVTPENLSLVVNQKFDMSFRDLLNHYRIEMVKTKLQNPRYEKSSILDLALASGFNSQASFYRAFKKAEGVTPKVFVANLNAS